MWLILPASEQEAGIPQGRRRCVTACRRPNVSEACCAEIRNAALRALEQPLCKGLRSSWLLTQLNCTNLGNRMLSCSSIILESRTLSCSCCCSALPLCKSSTAFGSSGFTSCGYFLTNRFHVPVSPVVFKTPSLQFPILGLAQCRCAVGSVRVCCCGAGVLPTVTPVSLCRRWVVVPGPRGTDP